jgi:hypothetical protein
MQVTEALVWSELIDGIEVGDEKFRFQHSLETGQIVD